jgi:hypothetical protein
VSAHRRSPTRRRILLVAGVPLRVALVAAAAVLRRAVAALTPPAAARGRMPPMIPGPRIAGAAAPTAAAAVVLGLVATVAASAAVLVVLAAAAAEQPVQPAPSPLAVTRTRSGSAPRTSSGANWTLRSHLRRMDPALERLQPQAGEPAGGAGAVLRLLQLLQVPQEHPHDARYGGRNHPEAVVDG